MRAALFRKNSFHFLDAPSIPSSIPPSIPYQYPLEAKMLPGKAFHFSEVLLTCPRRDPPLSFSLLLNTINNTTHYTKKDKQSKAEHSTKPIVFQDDSKMVRPIHETSSKKKETQPNTQETTQFLSVGTFSGAALSARTQCCCVVSWVALANWRVHLRLQ